MSTAARLAEPLFAGGEWVTTDETLPIANPYDGTLVGVVSVASRAIVQRAVESASTVNRDDFPAAERAAVLDRVAELVELARDDFARLIAQEAGKPLKQARAEAERATTTLRFSAVAARTLGGELLPLDAAASGRGKLGFTLRVPLGVVAAITPFNFPLNLVAHKLGPAIAAGNSVVVKPAPQAPLSALRLAELFVEGGLPSGWLHVVPGGADVGEALVDEPRVAAVSFTGSAPVGWAIRARAPKKKVLLELGATAPVIVDDTADLARAAELVGVHAFAYAGQSCISVQRLLVADSVADAFLERLLGVVEALAVGDPLDERTDVGPLIDAANCERVKVWIDSAVERGASLVAGGGVNEDGTLAPTVLLSAPRDHDVWRKEIFGPVVVVERFATFDEAIALANDSDFGLQAGVFTRDLERALAAARALEFGGVIVNDVPTTRVDHQPYGGVKDSGNTREGPLYAARELSELRFVSLQP